MSGECGDCGEHCLECTCKQSRSFLVTTDKFCIIGGDIHKLISRKVLDRLREKIFIPWFIEENKDFVWVPICDEKADYQKGKWVWIEYGGNECDLCKRKFFTKKLEG